MNAKLTIWAISAALAFLGMVRAADASGGPYFSYRTAVTWPIPWQSTYAHEHIPYFAQYPPVYYSYPVRRTYGHSPYAWLPVVPTRAYQRCKAPVILRNPYVSVAAPAAAGAKPVQNPPLRIANPYVLRRSTESWSPL